MAPAGHAGPGRQGHSSGPWEVVAGLTTSVRQYEAFEAGRRACEDRFNSGELWKLMRQSNPMSVGHGSM